MNAFKWEDWYSFNHESKFICRESRLRILLYNHEKKGVISLSEDNIALISRESGLIP